jgi:regulator of cell morphogenesis and NO signaling
MPVMNFSTETRVNEIALSNPAARRVLEDAGVDYCCGGGKSLGDACLQAGVTADEILNRLRQNAGLTGPADTEWADAPLAELTRIVVSRLLCPSQFCIVRIGMPDSCHRVAQVLRKRCR